MPSVMFRQEKFFTVRIFLREVIFLSKLTKFVTFIGERGGYMN